MHALLCDCMTHVDAWLLGNGITHKQEHSCVQSTKRTSDDPDSREPIDALEIFEVGAVLCSELSFSQHFNSFDL